jgi:TM2 domain-containing membrane protein YozV
MTPVCGTAGAVFQCLHERRFAGGGIRAGAKENVVMDRLQYLQSLKSIRDSVPPERRDLFDLHYGARNKDQAVALTLSICFGWFGLDRFYIGNAILGVLKLLTFGGFFIWTIIDWFLIMSATRRANVGIATEVRQAVG